MPLTIFSQLIFSCSSLFLSPTNQLLGLGLAKLRVLVLGVPRVVIFNTPLFFPLFTIFYGFSIKVCGKRKIKLNGRKKKWAAKEKSTGEKKISEEKNLSGRKKKWRKKKEERTKSILEKKRRDTCLLRKRRKDIDVPLKAP